MQISAKSYMVNLTASLKCVKTLLHKKHVLICFLTDLTSLSL